MDPNEAPVALSAADVAQFDQAWAASEHVLAYLVGNYAEARAKDDAEGVPEMVSIVQMAKGFEVFLRKDLLSSALAAAIVHYHRNLQAADG